MKFQHFIISRFNLNLFDSMSNQDAKNWMDYRLNIFDSFCYPSVVNQENQDFVWLIFFSNKTPEYYRQLISKYKRVIPIYCEEHGFDDIQIKGFINPVKQFINPDVDYIITTRIDVDDMISKDFVQKVQLEILKEHNVQLVFSLGYVLDLNYNVLMEREYIYNQFPSYIEKNSDDIKTVWFTQHGLIHKTAKTKIIHYDRMWCWLLHKKNLNPASISDNYKLPSVDMENLYERFNFNEKG